MPIVGPAEYATLPPGLVLVGGCFDPLHPGHLRYFEAAAVFGPVCCAVASDATIRETKGRAPVLSQEDRMELVSALHSIDFVIAQDDAGEAGALEDLRPKFYMKGDDWSGHVPPAIDGACQQFGIPQLFHQSPTRQSSTGLLQAWQQAMSANAVAQLEALVQRQRPTAAPWSPVTDYSVDGRTKREGRHPQLIRDHLVPAGGTVLDFGCGPDEHLVRLLKPLGLRVEGYDPQIVGSDAVLVCRYDLVICREVLEHLTLRAIRQTVPALVQRSTGLVYVTTRFAASPLHVLDIDESDDLDPTHITLLTKDFLRTLFLLEGCTSRPDLETALDWQQQGRCLVFEVPHV